MGAFIDGDRLYKGVTQIIAQHLDALAERDIVPTFPRTGIMTDTSSMATAGSGHLGQNASAGAGSGDNALNGYGGNADSSAKESEAVEMALEGERFLRTVKLVWEDHVAIMKKMQLVLKYMVRSSRLIIFLPYLQSGYHRTRSTRLLPKCRTASHWDYDNSNAGSYTVHSSR